MAIVAKNNGGSSIEPVKAGMHAGRCVKMYHIGTVEETFQNDVKQCNKVMIAFEIPGQMHTFDESKGAEPRIISKEFTLSMNPKANLRKMLESWRGVPFTEDEARAFDVTKLLGVPCLLNIMHKESKKGNKYADLTSITPMMEGTTAPDQIIPSFEFNYDNISEMWGEVPKYIQEKIKASAEFKQSGFVPPATEEDKSAPVPQAEAVAEVPVAQPATEAPTEAPAKPMF